MSSPHIPPQFQAHGITFPDIECFLEHEFVGFGQVFARRTKQPQGTTAAAVPAPGGPLDGAE